MKLEEQLKKKYFYSKENNFFKYIYIYINFLKSFFYYKKTYSQYQQDLFVKKIFDVLNIKKGFYIDVGCFHPYKYNNTNLLYQNGWSGINIDIDFHTIDFFKKIRKKDLNLQIAASDTKGEKDLYFFHNRSAINSLDPFRGKDSKEIKKIKTDTLSNIIKNSIFSERKVNFISIDVEGHELNVLKGLDINKYKPDLILIEYIDPKFKKNELFNQNIENIINSEIYKYLLNNGYVLINWIRSDLMFVNKELQF